MSARRDSAGCLVATGEFPRAQGCVLPSWKPQAFRELTPPVAALSASVALEQHCFVLQLFHVVPVG